MENEIKSLAKKFAQEVMAPQIAQDELDERFRPEWIASLGALGLTGVPVAEEWGGAGLGYAQYVLVIEELARVSAGYAISVAVTGLPQVILSAYGTPEQKKKYIPALASGQAIGAFSLSESFSGSDASALKTTAQKDGDGYVLSGTKLWCTQGDSAKTLMVMARTGAAGAGGISTFILEQGMPGFSLGKREKKMGCHVSHTMELVLDQVRVPASHLVGKEGDGFKIAMAALDSGRITIAACAVGVASAALDVAVTYAKEREQFGKPIFQFQGVGFMLADMATQIEAARLLVKQAATLKDAGLPYSQQAAMAKLFATDMAMKVTTDAVQVLGGAGYTTEFWVERYMREAKVLQIVEGTNQVQRLVIARGL